MAAKFKKTKKEISLSNKKEKNYKSDIRYKIDLN